VKAVVLCAGQGTRLMPMTQSVPKCLVPVAGAPILEYQMRALEGRVDEIILVTGYLHDTLVRFADGRCTIVRNEVYATTNSMYSLWLARQHVADREFLLLNGDVLFDADILGQVLDVPAATALLIDDQRPLVDGEMNVVVRDGLVVEIGKEIPLTRANAQSLQIVKFGATDGGLLFERIDELVEEGETGRFPTFAYETIFRRSAMSGVRREGGIWFEIDTVDDLARCEGALGALSQPTL
jgi:L-glutamine-phosphate cytidylyltransferase